MLLSIDSEIFKNLRNQFDVLLQALLQEVNTSGKEGELNIKFKVSTETGREFKEGECVNSWTEPRFRWTLVRKIKESKLDIKSALGEGYFLDYDSDGNLIMKEAPNKQITMFD